MKKILFVAVALMAMSTTNVSAETTQSNDVYLSTIYVNEQVTTHLIMPETIRLVDISTDTIVGNQVNDNIVRLKPKGAMQDYEQAGIVTVIGERHIAQYKLIYRSCLPFASTRSLHCSVLGYAGIPESRCEYVCRRNEPLCHPYL